MFVGPNRQILTADAERLKNCIVLYGHAVNEQGTKIAGSPEALQFCSWHPDYEDLVSRDLRTGDVLLWKLKEDGYYYPGAEGWLRYKATTSSRSISNGNPPH
jgi:hypothetical protein